MAINYEPVGWDTTKHFNPTNMNHMDGGIKAACDKVDEHDSEIAEINSNLKDNIKVSTVTVTLNSATQVTANQLVNLKGTFTYPDGYNPLAIVMQFIGKNPAGSSINYYTFGSDGYVDMYAITGATETLTSINLRILFSKI